MTQARQSEKSIGELVAEATAQVQVLVKAEIELAKAELKNDAKQAGLGAGMFGGAAFFGYFALIFLSVAGAFGIHALGITLGWSFLIVGGVYLVVAAILGALGKSRLDKMSKIERTKRTLRDDVTWAKALKDEIGSPPRRQEVGPASTRPAVGPPGR